MRVAASRWQLGCLHVSDRCTIDFRTLGPGGGGGGGLVHFAHSRERETRERGRARRGRPTRLLAAARAVAPSPTGHRVPAASRGARLTVYAEESAPIEGAVAHRPGRPLGVSRRRPSHRARLGGRAGGVRASRGRRWIGASTVVGGELEPKPQPRSPFAPIPHPAPNLACALQASGTAPPRGRPGGGAWAFGALGRPALLARERSGARVCAPPTLNPSPYRLIAPMAGWAVQ